MGGLVKKDNTVVSTQLVPWEQELAAEAEAEAKAEKVGANFFSTKGGTLTFNGQDLGHEVDVVVAGVIYDRAYYPGQYGDAKAPDCYSFSKDGVGMVPHEDAPNKQHTSCDACPHNQFGSATIGRGKACREYRRLALIGADELTAEEVSDATIGLLKVPPTSSKTYGEYVRSVSEVFKRPLWAMITQLKVMPDPHKQVVVSFKPKAQLSQEVAAAIKARGSAVTAALLTPYPVFTDAAPKEAPKGAVKNKFAVKAK